VLDGGTFNVLYKPQNERLVHHLEIVTDGAACIVVKGDGNAHRIKYEGRDATWIPMEHPPESGPIVRAMLLKEKDSSGAIHIFMVVHQGAEFYLGKGFVMVKVTVVWERGQDARSPSQWDKSTNSIFVQGRSDPDEFDASVLLHEYGHAFHTYFGPAYTGGNHDMFRKSAPRIAFSEGVATYLGQRTLNSRVYVDSGGSFTMRVDICALSGAQLGTSTRRSTGRICETLVACALWRAETGYGTSSFPGIRGLEKEFLAVFNAGPHSVAKGDPAFFDYADVVRALGCVASRRAAFHRFLSSMFRLSWLQEPGFC